MTNGGPSGARTRRLAVALVGVGALSVGTLIFVPSQSTAAGVAPVACTLPVTGTNPGGGTGTYVDTGVTPNVTYNTLLLANSSNATLSRTVTPSHSLKVQYIVVGGGGAGGNARTSGGAGGGGAGEVESAIGDANAVTMTAATGRTWVAGTGQATTQSNNGAGGNGTASTLVHDGGTITANGGGGGAGRATAASNTSIGSGGGGGFNNTSAFAPGTTVNGGSAGAAAKTGSGVGAGGGGGGFGATPAVSTTNNTGGRGGSATTANASLFGSIAGIRSTSNRGYAGGGGGSGSTAGGTATAADGSTAGFGGGGAGGSTTGTAGTAGLGGGGGASYANNASGRGGSGFILARWRKFCLVPSPPTASTVSGSSLSWTGDLAPTYIPVAGIAKYRIFYKLSSCALASCWKVFAETTTKPATSPITLTAAQNCGTPGGGSTWTCNPGGLQMVNGSTYNIAIVALANGSGSALSSAIVAATGTYTASGG